MLLEDSYPDLFLPIGFAGGLVDADTGLVRFGWRDYDPKVGRFTAPDPAYDRRGDGDVYDYCVDDPVSRKDTTGLAWDESQHPRDDIGKFTDKTGSDGGTASSSSEANISDQGVHSDNTSQTKEGIIDAALSALRPWWSLPYGDPKKTRGINELKDVMKQPLESFAKSFLAADKFDAKSQTITYGAKGLSRLLQKNKTK